MDGPTRATIIVAIIAAIGSGIAAGSSLWSSDRVAEVQAQVDQNEQAINQGVQSLEAKFRSEQEALAQQQERNQLLVTYLPKLLGGTTPERAEARAILFTVLPNDIAEVLERTRTATGLNVTPRTEDFGEILRLLDEYTLNTQLIEESKRLAIKTGDWGIVLGAYRDREAAGRKARQAENADLGPTRVYEQPDRSEKRKKLYYPAVRGFPTESDADSVLLGTRIGRVAPNGFVVNVNAWCPVDEGVAPPPSPKPVTCLPSVLHPR
jgi:hypothetical protein